jgi:hypothetical protein
MVQDTHGTTRSVEQTARVRTQASHLLDRLIVGRQASERRHAEAGRDDPMKSVTGASAFETAIDTTRGMIRDMDELLDELRRELALASVPAVTEYAGAAVGP